MIQHHGGPPAALGDERGPPTSLQGM
jgi:hypothetical protein